MCPVRGTTGCRRRGRGGGTQVAMPECQPGPPGRIPSVRQSKVPVVREEAEEVPQSEIKGKDTTSLVWFHFSSCFFLFVRVAVQLHSNCNIFSVFKDFCRGKGSFLSFQMLKLHARLHSFYRNFVQLSAVRMQRRPDPRRVREGGASPWRGRRKVRVLRVRIRPLLGMPRAEGQEEGWWTGEKIRK